MIPPIASCNQYVSLVRSCYSTTARFFADDLTIETPITWCFTSPDAQWCGVENVFNSRNWYGGEIGWPELGEVQGAARTWSNGTGCCNVVPGVFGKADQWANGCQTADALDSCPCEGPGYVTAWPLTDSACIFEGLGVNNLTYYPAANVWATASVIRPPYWWTLRYGSDKPACCYPARAKRLDLTTGPPNFTTYREGHLYSVDVGCSSTWVYDFPVSESIVYYPKYF